VLPDRIEIGLYDLCEFRVFKITSVIEALKTGVSFDAINASNHSPGTMVVRSDSHSGCPGHGEHGKALIFFLVHISAFSHVMPAERNLFY
jgi:hypothetical protein